MYMNSKTLFGTIFKHQLPVSNIFLFICSTFFFLIHQWKKDYESENMRSHENAFKNKWETVHLVKTFALKLEHLDIYFQNIQTLKGRKIN